MPIKNITSDNQNSFTLARKVFVKTIKNSNNKSIDNKIKSFNNDSSTRTQKIRLISIGYGSIKNNTGNTISFNSHDSNFVNNRLSRLRSSGGYKPKY